jgi:hypothetical protein
VKTATDDDDDEIKALLKATTNNGRFVVCPKCGAGPRQTCRTQYGAIRCHHRERVLATKQARREKKNSSVIGDGADGCRDSVE